MHSGKPDFIVGKRQAGCGAGAYVVHALEQRAAV